MISCLGFPDTQRLVSQITGAQQSDATPLAEDVFFKTGGNPLHVHQYLLTGAAEKALVRDLKTGAWGPPPASAPQSERKQDLAEYLREKVLELPEHCRNALLACSCAGTRFDSETAALLVGGKPNSVANLLQPALEQDLLRREAGERKGDAALFRFPHDRVFQAAYDLLDPKVAQGHHLALARSLEARLMGAPQTLFDCVYHFNKSRPLLTEPALRHKAAAMNLSAAKQARETAAFAPALDYLVQALEWLPENAWEECYELACETYTLAAEAACLNGRFELADQWSRIALEQARTPVEKAQIWRVLLQSHVPNGRFAEAVDAGLCAMKELGFEFSPNPGKMRLVWDHYKTKNQISIMSNEDLENLPLMEDAISRAFMSLVIDILPAAYFVRPTLLPVIVFSGIRLCIKYGVAPESSAFFAFYGFVISTYFNELDLGYKMAIIAVRLLKKFKENRYLPTVFHICNVGPLNWKENYSNRPPRLLESVRVGMEEGSFEYAAYSGFGFGYMALFSGMQLDNLANEMAALEKKFGLMSQSHMKSCLMILHQAILNLITPSKNPISLEGEAFSESSNSDLFLSEGDLLARTTFYLFKCMLACFFLKWEQAFELHRLAWAGYESMKGLPAVPMAVYYQSLALVSLSMNENGKKRGALLGQVSKNVKELSFWARHAPMNHLHRVELIRAERARVKEDFELAGNLYEQAAVHAKENGFVQDEALARELFGRFFLSLDNPDEARRQLLLARSAYSAWGSRAKVKDLEERYAHVLKDAS
ncbi:MAG: hypothetical protein AB1921_12510 [Thermodesulfobacteriota bacterium]